MGSDIGSKQRQQPPSSFGPPFRNNRAEAIIKLLGMMKIEQVWMLSLVLMIACGTVGFLIGSHRFQGGGGCQMYLGDYHGKEYRTDTTVGKPSCLLESKWMKVQQHAVSFDGKTVLDDWLWIDYHDRINVLVEKQSGEFYIFQQTKYALEGRQSKAIIGGIIEPGEDAETAARREVEEELDGLQCQEYHFLGRFRTDVNRGMGWVNSFLATQCSHPKSSQNDHLRTNDANAAVVGAADTERQDLETITLSELKQAAQNGDFLEVQWTATVSLALLHME